MRVEIRRLTKTFDAYKALDEVPDVREGEFCALLGPSGSGKTTLPGIIAGSSSRTAARSALPARTWSGATRASARSASSSSTTRCSAT